MGKKPVNIAEAEWAVLEVLWDKGPATMRQLTDVLYPKGGPSEYATVHKLLERLDGKDCVHRERREGVFVFEASRPRDDVVGEQFEDVASFARAHTHHTDGPRGRGVERDADRVLHDRKPPRERAVGFVVRAVPLVPIGGHGQQ